MRRPRPARLHRANQGSRGHSSLWNAPLGWAHPSSPRAAVPYQSRAGSQWPSVDSRLLVRVKPGHKVVDRAQSSRPQVILWQLSAFQSCFNGRRRPVNVSARVRTPHPGSSPSRRSSGNRGGDFRSGSVPQAFCAM